MRKDFSPLLGEFYSRENKYLGDVDFAAYVMRHSYRNAIFINFEECAAKKACPSRELEHASVMAG